MTILRVLSTFLAVTLLATAAFATAAFMTWSLLDVQPGTAVALGTLFLLAPGAGLVTGIVAAARATRPAPPRNPGLAALLNGALGVLAGYGVATVVLGLTDPASTTYPPPPPAARRGWAPWVAGLALGAALAVRALRR